MLNRSKGPAVWAPRAQADKKAYQIYMTNVLERQANLLIKQGQVVEILIHQGVCHGVRTQIGQEFYARAVLLTTGTFLNGLIHIGQVTFPSGRDGEAPAIGLSDSLRQHGINLVRFKTGTPPRLHARSINWKVLEEQNGDNPPPPFSFRTNSITNDQISCYITYTTANTRDLVLANLDKAPLYSGQIQGVGPRYCPSFEVKVKKFADKQRHQIYLEPEGKNSKEIYVNGFSTSLPQEIQEEMIHSTPGLENAEIIRLGYAIEYDCAPPTQLKHTLETKKIENLFFAGQINCTSGYEEAAAQGLIAGLNIVCKFKESNPFILDRSEAYIGVLIDDLVTKGTEEPYRMFTSLAEFRLVLRQDNADERLSHYGYQFGLISQEDYERTSQKISRIKDQISFLKKAKRGPWTLEQILKRPESSLTDMIHKGIHSAILSNDEIHRIETEVKYEGYICRQKIEVEKFRKAERKKIPFDINYEKVRGIRHEAKEKFIHIKPATIAQAARIPGISPCDVSVLAIHLESHANNLK
jgi:tRNA uridine 5-carboxymethylaminomethyl modification enzyme